MIPVPSPRLTLKNVRCPDESKIKSATSEPACPAPVSWLPVTLRKRATSRSGRDDPDNQPEVGGVARVLTHDRQPDGNTVTLSTFVSGRLPSVPAS
jgi:hypothetical protein